MVDVVFGGANGIGSAIVGILEKDWIPTIVDRESHPVHPTIIANLPLKGSHGAKFASGDRFHRVFITIGRPSHRSFNETNGNKQRSLMSLNFEAVTSALHISYPFLWPESSVTVVSSVSAQRADPGGTIYAAAKAGVEALVRGLAREWAPIRVNAIAPGPTATEQFMENVPTLNRVLESSRSPHNRLLSPFEVAEAAVAISNLTGVSGVVLPVDLAGISSSRRD
jgi:NAD(P)-dependent dehydrogenase (short-subunit alcohol dehydrogenase family)